MTEENKIAIAKRPPVAKDQHNIRQAKAKAVMVAAWAPQPNPLTREEIRRFVIDQIG